MVAMMKCIIALKAANDGRTIYVVEDAIVAIEETGVFSHCHAIVYTLDGRCIGVQNTVTEIMEFLCDA
jgi:hypothetical protein